MRVDPEPLPELDVLAMRAVSSDERAGIVAGETLGYYCGRCGQADETLEQVVHEDECDYAGDHGRSVYGAELDVESFDWESRGELHPSTEFSVLKWNETLPAYGAVLHEPVAVRCDGCGALDETLFELVHHDECQLSLSKAPVAADG